MKEGKEKGTKGMLVKIERESSKGGKQRFLATGWND